MEFMVWMIFLVMQYSSCVAGSVHWLCWPLVRIKIPYL